MPGVEFQRTLPLGKGVGLDSDTKGPGPRAVLPLLQKGEDIQCDTGRHTIGCAGSMASLGAGWLIWGNGHCLEAGRLVRRLARRLARMLPAAL